MARPNPAATTALAATVTQRAGCAAIVLAMVPCCTSDVCIRMPAITASTVVSHVAVMKVLATVNGRCS